MKKVALLLVLLSCAESVIAAPTKSLVAAKNIAMEDTKKEQPYPLPDGVVAVEYIESTGTQYINLPFGFDPSDSIDMHAALSQKGQDKYLVAPTRWNDNSNRFALAGESPGGYFGIGFGNKSTNQTILRPLT